MNRVTFTRTWIATLVAGAGAQAATVGYWRFEDNSNLGLDSGPNTLTLTNSNTVGATATPFTNPVPQTNSSNTGAASFAVASSRFLSVADNALFTFPSDGDFTIESYVQVASAGSSSTVRAIAGHFNSGTEMAWQLGVAGTGSSLGARSLFMQISRSDDTLISFSVPTGTSTAFQLQNGTNYYVAASVDFVPGAVTPRTDVTLYVKNLTTNSAIQTYTASSTSVSSLVNANARFAIGATYATSSSSRHFDGTLDEVRLSTGALGESSLLVSVPEPGSAALLASGFTLLGIRRRSRR